MWMAILKPQITGKYSEKLAKNPKTTTTYGKPKEY